MSHKPNGSPPGLDPDQLPSQHAAASTSSPRTMQHAPMTPSKLRSPYFPTSSPENTTDIEAEDGSKGKGSDTGLQSTQVEEDGKQTILTSPTKTPGHSRVPSEANARTHLLSQRSVGRHASEHGTFTSRPVSHRSYGSVGSVKSQAGYGGIRTAHTLANESDRVHATLGEAVTDGLLGGNRNGKPTATHWLAKKHGVRHSRMMYVFYYIPISNWIRQYKLSYLRGDIIAALTMASFYIPMSLSYASNLGHIPPINGLYAFVFNPIIYAIFGTCPLMVVGPEAAGSLLTGQVVRENINRGRHKDTDDYQNAQIAGTVTGLAGAIIFVAGIARLGFLDNVLSRPFLRGFISAIGIVILIDQLVPETGLNGVAAHDPSGAAHGSSMEKIIFLIENASKAHGLTCAVSFGSFAIIMILREVKRRLQSRMNWVAYIPDRFVIVVLSAVLTWKFDWANQGLEITGSISAKGAPFKYDFPFDWRSMTKTADVFSTSFLIALLGFFESSVAAKSLGASVQDDKGLQNVTLSANRELVALGIANIVGGSFMALPAFGGYGRSKVNVSTGGLTPMSSIFLGIISILCVLFLLPYFYYIPKGVLSAMISVVAWSLLEEIPHDLYFFIRIRGIQELFLMSIIFLVTFFFDLKAGIAVGIGLSLLRLVRHSTRPRIQILGRVPGTRDRFENIETYRAIQSHSKTDPQTSRAPTLCESHPQTPISEQSTTNPMDAIVTRNLDSVPPSTDRRKNQDSFTARSSVDGRSAGESGSETPIPNDRHRPSVHPLEFIPGTLIIKIPEPLFFANTGSLRARLARLEAHGTTSAHPALPKVRSSEQNQIIIFDIHGVTSLDGAGAQVLADVVREYVEQDVGVWFCRMPGVTWTRNGTFKAEGPVWSMFRQAGIVEECGGEGHFLNSLEDGLDAAEAEERRKAQERAFEEIAGTE